MWAGIVHFFTVHKGIYFYSRSCTVAGLEELLGLRFSFFMLFPVRCNCLLCKPSVVRYLVSVALG